MIYFNNAATGFPKFKETTERIRRALDNGDIFCNRDSIEFVDIAKEIFDLRDMLGSSFMKAEEPYDICFTYNDTLALNMLIFGLGLKAGDAVLTSEREHNSVSRPLMQLSKKGVKVIFVPYTDDNDLDYTFVEDILKKYQIKVKLGIFTHASNVTGDVIDAECLGNILLRYGVPFVLDTAQSIGVYPIDVEKFHTSAVAFAGHKALNGPQGTGGFYIRKEFEKDLNPIIFGGTGNNSYNLLPPTVFPEAFEVGTPAIHDLLGLSASLKVIDKTIGKEQYSKTMVTLAQYLHDKLSEVPNITIYGKTEKKAPVVSFNIKGYSSNEIGEYLGRFNIVCRTGVHCAALAMQSLGVDGTIRFSLGYSNTKEEVDFVIGKLMELPQK